MAPSSMRYRGLAKREGERGRAAYRDRKIYSIEAENSKGKKRGRRE